MCSINSFNWRLTADVGSLTQPWLLSSRFANIAQLRFLCETLYHDCLANLEESNHGWVNDPTSAVNLQLNELIEHIATFALKRKSVVQIFVNLSDQLIILCILNFIIKSECGNVLDQFI